MRISDWSSDVCSSDIARPRPLGLVLVQALTARREIESAGIVDTAGLPGLRLQPAIELGTVGLQLGDVGDAVHDMHEIGRHTSELQSLMRSSYAVFRLKTKTKKT